MKLAYVLAATAALWVQPASAGILFYGVGAGEYMIVPGCTISTPVCYETPVITEGLFAVGAEIPDAYIGSGGFSVSDFSTACPLEGPCGLSAQFGGGFTFGAFSRTSPFVPIEQVLIAGPSFRYTTADVQFFRATFSFLGPIRPVPEPSTWAMMLLGFGALGYGMRARRQKLTVTYTRTGPAVSHPRLFK